MKKQKKRKGIRFKATWQYSSTKEQSVESPNSEDLVALIRRAEKEVLPLIRQAKLGPGAALLLLAQYTYSFTSGSYKFSEENLRMSAKTVLSLWEDGSYAPDRTYPFTLEETIQDIQGGLKGKNDYSDSFQAFSPLIRDEPRGIGQVSGGIVKHPDTNLWQIWMIADGPCTYLGAYSDPKEAQRNLTEIIQAARKGGTVAESQALYTTVLSRGNGQPKQITFDMLTYLMEHIHSYQIKL